MIRVHRLSGRPVFNPRWVLLKTQKMVLDGSLFNTQHYKVMIEGKWRNPGKGVAPSPTPRCRSYWKGSLQIALDYSRPTYLVLNDKVFGWIVSISIKDTNRFVTKCLGVFEYDKINGSILVVYVRLLATEKLTSFLSWCSCSQEENEMFD